MTEEEFLIDKIRAIQQAAELEAKPYVDRLVQLRSLEPRVMVPVEWLTNCAPVLPQPGHSPAG